LLIVATAVFEELHMRFGSAVRLTDVPSKSVPLATNRGFVPGAAEEFAGVTAMDTTGFATVRVAIPDTPPEVAEMVTDPGATAVAKPVALTVAVALLVDCQVAVAVRSCVVWSAKVPTAMNCCVLPGAVGLTVAVAGVTAMDVSGFATVRVVVPVTVPDVAVIVVVPPATAVASPVVLIAATAGLEDNQLAVAVRFFVVPSL
jgi:hypothetical protein